MQELGWPTRQTVSLTPWSIRQKGSKAGSKWVRDACLCLFQGEQLQKEERQPENSQARTTMNSSISSLQSLARGARCEEERREIVPDGLHPPVHGQDGQGKGEPRDMPGEIGYLHKYINCSWNQGD